VRAGRRLADAGAVREGSFLGRLQDVAKVMLVGQGAPSLTALTFAAAAAGAAGDAKEERRLIDQALAADAAGDRDVRLEVIDFISTSGYAAEAVELLEPRLSEAPDDDFPDGQREAMMAEAKAQLRAQHQKDVEAPGGPQRWACGVLRVRGREITVEVNSVQRLTRLTGIFRKVGAEPEVTSEKRIDPAQPKVAPLPRAGRSCGSMRRCLRCPAEHPGRPRAAGSGRAWRRCCGNSSMRPSFSPPMARPASIPPGCASSSTC
jgi:hypothetical protein